MCDFINTNTVDYPKLHHLDKRIKSCENIALKIKAMKFENFQSFDFVSENFEQGEVYAIDGVGYTVITKKTPIEVCFIVFMDLNNIWKHHFQDVDKHLIIKQGVYLDLYTNKEYMDEVNVKAFEPSYFKASGTENLILKGRVFKKETL